jgi:hypothetical protein
MSNTNTASVSVVANVAALTAKIEEAKALDREFAELQRMTAMDAAKAAANPAYVAGSLRKPTAEDAAALGSRLHAVYVGDIRCTICGQLSVRNAGDLHQVKTCEACAPEARKAAGKTKRATKRVTKMLAGTGDIDAALAEKKAALEALKAKLAAKS